MTPDSNVEASGRADLGRRTVVCHACGGAEIELSTAFPALSRVTSDCKPWGAGGSLARCNTCGLVQVVVDSIWKRDAEAIYAGYTIYHQSGGVEQSVFAANSSGGVPRSTAILDRLRSHVELPKRGRLLDVGCGNGAFLRACSTALPGWTLAGSEFDGRYREQVESIPGVERLYPKEIDAIPGTFDLVSMIHVLEHIPSPLDLLAAIAEKVSEGGLLLIEVPDCSVNPFMLLVADHCSHFSPGVLGDLMAAAGFEVIVAAGSWIPKEVTVVARMPAGGLRPRGTRTSGSESPDVFGGVERLRSVIDAASRLASRPPFGIFGTSIAATWLNSQLGGVAEYFVDEDTNRIGKRHMGVPIISAAEVPEGGALYFALPEPIAKSVARRVARVDVRIGGPGLDNRGAA
jgi:SAM-dependent methyltransferase